MVLQAGEVLVRPGYIRLKLNRICNVNYGGATFAFVGSKIWENIPSKLKKNSLITSISNTNCTF